MYLILRKTWFSGFYYPFLVTVVELVRCVKPTCWCARKQKTQSPPTFKYVPEYFYERRSVHAPVLTIVCPLNQNHLIHLLPDPFHSIFKLARFLSRIHESIRGCVRPLVHLLVSQSVGLWVRVGKWKNNCWRGVWVGGGEFGSPCPFIRDNIVTLAT